MSEQSSPPPLDPESLTSRLRISQNAPALRLVSLILPLAALAGVAVVGGLLLTGYLHITPGPETPAGKRMALLDKAAKNAEFGEEADHALYRVSWKESLSKLQVSAGCCDELIATLPKLNDQIIRLKTDESGRRIASRTEWIDQFSALCDRPRLTEADIHGQRESITLLIEKCEHALGDANIDIPCKAEFIAKCTGMHETLSQAQKEISEDQRRLTALVSMSQSAALTDEALSEAVAKRAQELETESLVRIAEAQAAQREAAERKRREAALEAERKIQVAQAEQERIDQEARIAAEEAEKKRKDQEAKLAAQRAAAAQAHREKVAAFEREFPAMKSLLAPFISSGQLQLQGSQWVGGEEGPVSLSAIHQLGALNPNAGTSHMLMYFGNGVNGRPTGSFPRGHAYDSGQVYRVQTFLLKYGDILVEKKLLRP